MFCSDPDRDKKGIIKCLGGFCFWLVLYGFKCPPVSQLHFGRALLDYLNWHVVSPLLSLSLLHTQIFFFLSSMVSGIGCAFLHFILLGLPVLTSPFTLFFFFSLPPFYSSPLWYPVVLLLPQAICLCLFFNSNLGSFLCQEKS